MVVGAAGMALHGQSMATVKALLFDVFGTVVDWRGSIIDEGKGFGYRASIKLASRMSGGPGIWPLDGQGAKAGKCLEANLDHLHRMLLDDLLKKFHAEGLSEVQKDHWNRVWHRLKPWPDSVAGLTRLKKNYTIAPLSNGNIALLTNMAKHAGLPWDLILSAELARHYKPDRGIRCSQPAGRAQAGENLTNYCSVHAIDLASKRRASYGLNKVHSGAG